LLSPPQQDYVIEISAFTTYKVIAVPEIFSLRKNELMSGSSSTETSQLTHNCNNPEHYHLNKTCCEIFKTHNIIIYLIVTLKTVRYTNIMEYTAVVVGCNVLVVEMTVAQVQISILIAAKTEC
jgi:hypothetical protein